MASRSSIAALIKEQIPAFSFEHAEVPFERLGVDNFGLLALRASVEQDAGRPIEDHLWLEAKTPGQLLSLFDDGKDARAAAADGKQVDVRRRYRLNMPQMALGGLSESWLFKELGDLHWSMITSGLGVSSSALCDGNGSRLYATFTRLRIEATCPLLAFVENEDVSLHGAIERFGAGMFFSTISLQGPAKAIRASAMSSFTKRGASNGNTSLLKGQAVIPPGCRIRELQAMPEIGDGYRLRRKSTPAPALFETEYEFIPYHDINGVGLLYFAAYPTISDICELRYMGLGNQWALTASSVSRDIFYFANSDIHDRLIYRVHSRKDRPGEIEIESSLSRASDGTLMAYLVTKKAVTRA